MTTHLSSRNENFEYWIGVLKISQHIVDKQWNVWYGLHIYYLKWVDDHSLYSIWLGNVVLLSMFFEDLNTWDNSLEIKASKLGGDGYGASIFYILGV